MMQIPRLISPMAWSTGALALSLCATPFAANAQAAPSQASPAAPGGDSNRKKIDAIPISRLVTATCRQAWHMSGENEDGFFDIVQRLTALSAHNRDITLPDNKEAGARAGEWIREQALKDPDQLLYAIVDHAVVYNSKPGNGAAQPGAQPGTQQ